jgi:acyl-CoA synthetase (AMP-forming)/AMP-acid ligase II/acyl carrier protein
MQDPNRSFSELTIYNALATVSRKHAHAIALNVPGRESYTYEQLFLRINQIAECLIDQGVSQASLNRVAIVMPNSPEMSISVLGVALVATAVPFNPSYTEEEYLFYLQQSNSDFLLIDDQQSEALKAAVKLDIKVIKFKELAEFSAKNSLHQLPNISPSDIALLLLTSGSTGRSKIVPLTHLNLCSSAMDVVKSLSLSSNDRCLSMWEQFHIGGIVDLLLAPLISGGQVISAGSFNSNNFFKLLEDFKPTWFQGVPTTLKELCFVIKKNQYEVRHSSLRLIRSVAAALPEASLIEIQSLFKVPVIRTFGMTEASPLISSTEVNTSPLKLKTVGRPCGPEVQIHDSIGKALPIGRDGLIAIKGPNVFSGYEGDDSANQETFKDGWFYTGDTGYFDIDGDLFITGRVKEMINRGGEKVSPKEIDDVILKHPAILEAATFSIPHPTLGEEIGLAVVLKPGAKITQADLKAFASLSLSQFKVPSRLIFMEHLPKCPVGKIRRQEIAQYFTENDNNHRKIIFPANSMEKILQLIWMEELDLEEIGVEDEFSEIGGDSLSSLRIILSVQNIFGIKIPESHAKRYTTIRKMAEALDEIGLSDLIKDETFQHKVFGLLSSKQAKKSHMMELVTKKISAFDHLSSKILYQCDSIFEFDTYRYAIQNISTPAEMFTFLKSSPSYVERIIYFLKKKISLITALQIMIARNKMRRDFFRSIRNASNPFNWKRVKISSHVDLFTNSVSDLKIKTLVVGFSSRGMRLTAPTYQVLSCFPSDVDLLLIRDANRNHFKYGVPGIGDNPEEVAAWLKSYLKDNTYKKIVGLGTSSGGLMSVFMAIKQQWSNVLACGCDRLETHPHLSELLKKQSKQTFNTKIVCAYSAGNARDKEGSAQLKNLLPNIEVIADTRFKEHALLYELSLLGELNDFFASQLINKK